MQLKPNLFVCKTNANGTQCSTFPTAQKEKTKIEYKTIDLKRNFVEFRRLPKTHWYLKKAI